MPRYMGAKPSSIGMRYFSCTRRLMPWALDLNLDK
jgi:hypothetical protein